MLPTLHETFPALCWPYLRGVIPCAYPPCWGCACWRPRAVPPTWTTSTPSTTAESSCPSWRNPPALPPGSPGGLRLPHPPVPEAVAEFARQHALGGGPPATAGG